MKQLVFNKARMQNKANTYHGWTNGTDVAYTAVGHIAGVVARHAAAGIDLRISWVEDSKKICGKVTMVKLVSMW